MSYKVSFEADTIPADLPAGAKVERKSVLPLTLNTSYSGKRFQVRKASGYSGGALVEYPSGGHDAKLSKDEVRKLVTALQETIGELPPVPGVGADNKVAETIELPKVVTTNLSRKFKVSKTTAGAHIITEETGAYGQAIHAALSVDNARDIAHALLAAIGEPVNAPAKVEVGDVLGDEQPPNNVKVVKDGSGDRFYRVLDNPSSEYTAAWRLNSRCGSATWSWDEIKGDTPVTVVEVQ